MRYARLALPMIGLFVASISPTLDLRAQGGSSATDPARAWRRTPRGLGAHGNPVRHRTWGTDHLRQTAVPRWKRPQTYRGTIYSAPYYAITTPWAIPNLRSDPYPYPTAHSPATRKPFAGIRPAPTAVDRYWPLLYEAREDPKTGLIIWSLP